MDINMKKVLLLAALIFIPASGLRAEDGCDKASDACAPRIKKATPFMAELEKAQTAPAFKQGPDKTPSLKQGGSKARPEVSAAPAPAAAPSAPLEGGKTVSHPAWLLAAAGLLAGLYYFLKENKKKGKGR